MHESLVTHARDLLVREGTSHLSKYSYSLVNMPEGLWKGIFDWDENVFYVCYGKVTIKTCFLILFKARQRICISRMRVGQNC